MMGVDVERRGTKCVGGGISGFVARGELGKMKLVNIAERRLDKEGLQTLLMMRKRGLVRELGLLRLQKVWWGIR